MQRATLGCENGAMREYGNPYDEMCTKRYTIGTVSVNKDVKLFPKNIQRFLIHQVHLMSPREVYICDGSQAEAANFTSRLVERGTLSKLKRYKNSFLCRTDPDTTNKISPTLWPWSSYPERADAEAYICTHPQTPCPTPKGRCGVMAGLRWMNHCDMKAELDARFPNCMAGRIMYVIPFRMGPAGSPLCKIGIQVTDSCYLLLHMRIMTQIVGVDVLNTLRDDVGFIKCVHSMGCPRPRHVLQKSLKDRTIAAIFPQERQVKCFGDGFGARSFIGKKWISLTLASVMARDEGWLAEQMNIFRITTPPPHAKEFFVASTFPANAFPLCNVNKTTQSSETNLPSTGNRYHAEYQVKIVGVGVAWMRFDEKGVMRAFSPELAFSGVAPRTNKDTDYNAWRAMQKGNCLFTNVAETDAGGVYWKWLEEDLLPVIKDSGIVDWRGTRWTNQQLQLNMSSHERDAAHENSRFTFPMSQLPNIHPKWQDCRGVPISAIIFGGKEDSYPAVVESKTWPHGVLMGACFRAGHFKRDPAAIGAHIGYNFCDYLQHWLDLEKSGRRMPKVFHMVSRTSPDMNQYRGGPCFMDNCISDVPLVEWILRRCAGDETIHEETPMGYVPKEGTVHFTGEPKGNKILHDDIMTPGFMRWKETTRKNLTFLKEEFGVAMPDPILFVVEKQVKVLVVETAETIKSNSEDIKECKDCQIAATPHSAIFHNLKKADLVELKSLPAPPQAVKDVLHAVMVLLGRLSSSSSSRPEDQWNSCRKHLSDPKFLDALRDFDPGTVTARDAQCARRKIAGRDYSPGDGSMPKSANGLLGWARAVLEVAP